MSVVIKFPPHLKPTLKHLAGQHDQKTHGRWAATGLPHEITNYEEGFQDLRDAGLLQKAQLNRHNEPVVSRRVVVDRKFITSTRREDMPPDYIEDSRGSGVWLKYGEQLARNNMDAPLTSLNIEKMRGEIEESGKMDDELKEKLTKISEGYVSAYREDVELHYAKVAQENGMTGRNADYFVTAMSDRVGIYITNTNQQVRFELAKTLAPYLPEEGKRIFLTGYFKQYEKTAKTFAENLKTAFPVIAIDGQDFMNVIADGRFKTQFETRESNGAYKPYLRRTRELAYMGVTQDTKASERPIYGYLANQIQGTSPNTSGYNRDRWNINNDAVSQYGEVRVVLNDDVRERTSYTVIDSLDGYALARPLTENHTRATMEMAGLQHDMSPSHGGFQREGYGETQVYGGVKLKDIKAIYVTPVEGKINQWTIDGIQNALEKKGVNIPVLPLKVED